MDGRLSQLARAGIIATAIAAWSYSAGAAPILYDCDAAAGTYSNIDLTQSGPAYRVVGRVAGNYFRRHNDWHPVANVRLIAANKKNAVGIRVRRVHLNGPIEFVLQTWVDGRESLKVLSTLRRDEPAPFSIEVEGGITRVRAAGQELVVDPVIGSGATIQIACSTGRFVFEDLDWDPPAPR